MENDKTRVAKLREKINERWRYNLFKICVLLAAIGSVTEIVIYLIDSHTRTLFLPDFLYQLRFIYIPSSLNLIVILITYNRIHSNHLSDNTKNIWSCILIYFLCANTQFIHYIYGPLLILPVISIFVSIIFANRRLTFGITISSLISLAASSIVSANELRKNDPQLIADTGLAALVLLVSQIGASLMIAYVNEQFESIATSNQREKMLIEEMHLDPLMGIYNRMALNEKIAFCLEQKLFFNNCQLLLLDLDDFKSINDTYGHLSGDDVLIQLSDTIRRFTSQTINAYRYGGEEIILIFENHTLEDAYALSEKLRLAFTSLTFDFDEKNHVTFSGGISTLQENTTAESWIHSADTALYQAKLQGKNRIVK